MDKIGIVRSIFYYYHGQIWINYLKALNIPYIISPKTKEKTIQEGELIAPSEACYALKIYLGHVKYLQDKCDYILIPREDNYKNDNQVCTNFQSIYDLCNNLFKTKIINYNIDLNKNQTLKKGLIKIGLKLGKNKKECIKAYSSALKKYKINRKQEVLLNHNKLKSTKTKVLLVSHPYITYGTVISEEIIKYLMKNNITIIYSDKFEKVEKYSKNITNDLYFKASKENLGAVSYCHNKVDGIIFLSAFPCALDSLALEMAFHKIKKPYLNLVLDTTCSFTGIETRLESFIDVIKGGVYD